MVRLAVVGTGFQGQGHLASLKKIAGVELVAICDKNEQTLRKAEKKTGLPAYSDCEKMLDERKPDGVVLCTPPEARLAPITKVVERRIPCFVEKPPAKDVRQGEQIHRLFEESGVMNNVGFMFRYAGAVDQCREWLRGRKVSLVRSAMLDGLAFRDHWPRWFFDKEKSGGAIFDQAIHIFDLCRYLLDDEVEAAAGFQENLVVAKSDNFTVEDSFSLSLRYRSGVLQNHTHSWAFDGYYTKIEFISDRLCLVLDLADGSVRGHLDEEPVFFQNEESFYERELAQFAMAIRDQDSTRIRSDFGDSLKSLATTLGIVKALEKNSIVHF
ncbi:MAG TPA: Gfo/Idh/MocA family oxidoreductase [Bacillales bacterium]|nr:Gfo/Idh/MocA family oxidoreductase [Bacillales bacterium]